MTKDNYDENNLIEATNVLREATKALTIYNTVLHEQDDYINSYQRWVDSTVWDTVRDDVEWATTALTSEVGEWAQMVEKSKRKGVVYNPDEVASELGDILWNITNLCTLHNITLSDLMEYNIDKITFRQKAKSAVSEIREATDGR